MAAKLRVTQIKSTISHIARNRATVRALGLHRIWDTVEVPDNEATRGMVRQVRFLVRVEEIAGEADGRAPTPATETSERGAEPPPADAPPVARPTSRRGRAKENA